MWMHEWLHMDLCISPLWTSDWSWRRVHTQTNTITDPLLKEILSDLGEIAITCCNYSIDHTFNFRKEIRQSPPPPSKQYTKRKKNMFDISTENNICVYPFSMKITFKVPKG